jgi:flagellar biosynthesis chaperone FliJ
MADFLNEDCAINCGTSVNSIEKAIDKLLHLTQEQKEAYVNAGERVCLAHSWYLQAYKLEQVYAKVLQQHEDQTTPQQTPSP